MTSPAEGDLRVWHIPQVPMAPFTVSVPDFETAKFVLDVLDDYDEFQLKNRVKPDYFSVNGVQRYEDGYDENDQPCLDWYDVDEEEYLTQEADSDTHGDQPA